jgi:hypothetical protein
MKISSFSMISVASAFVGEEIQCIGSRAHAVSYDITGDSLDTLTDAVISIKPSPEANAKCGDDPTQGDRPICVGSNVDATCSTSSDVVPINDILDCRNCFAGAGTDLYYSLNITGTELQAVEVGLRGNHIRGAVEVHGNKQGSGPLSSGTMDLVDASRTAKISFKVAKVVPVDITIGMPTSLDYAFSWDGELDAVAGADLDIDLGDHFVTWTQADGFVTHNTSSQVTVTPVLAWNRGDANMDAQLDLNSEFQVDIDQVMWYHLHMHPSFPSKVGFSHEKQDQFCAVGDADFLMHHEADVHFTLFGKEHDVYHFGPKDLYHYHKDQALNHCVPVGAAVEV